MTPLPSAYSGHTIVFATMHGKEQLAADAFANVLGAAVIAPDHLDTDQFGTFAGDIARTRTPRSAATVKARLGMQISGLPLGRASEGSFRSSLIGTETAELLLFIDDDRGFELVEHITDSSPLPPSRPIAKVDDALDYARSIGFPNQGLLIKASSGSTVRFHKQLNTIARLVETVARGLDENLTLTALPDHRAHRSPDRADRIRALCTRMAYRLATACPACARPGYGIVDIECDLPCALCGAPTAAIAADVHGCAFCGHKQRHPRVGLMQGSVTTDF